MRMLELQDGGRRINNIFGEGTSPRFRLITRGMACLGIKSDIFLKHYSPRIVYSIELAKNTNDFLCGFTDELEYPFDVNDPEVVTRKTNDLIDYWYNRWLCSRLLSVDIVDRLEHFNVNTIILGAAR